MLLAFQNGNAKVTRGRQDVGNAEDSGWSDFILIPSGKDGDDGDSGATFTPSISNEGLLSWTNNGGLENPSPVNIMGKKGEKGDKGDDGSTGITLGIIKSYDKETGLATVQEANNDWTENPDGVLHYNVVVP